MEQIVESTVDGQTYYLRKGGWVNSLEYATGYPSEESAKKALEMAPRNTLTAAIIDAACIKPKPSI